MSELQLRSLLRALEEWPNDRPLTLSILHDYPALQGNPAAINAVVMECFVRERGSGNRVTISTFLEGFEGVGSSLESQLNELDAFLDSSPDVDKEGDCTPVALPCVGDTVCDLKLLKNVGDGNFSRVFLAADQRLGGRRVIVKLCRPRSTERGVMGVYAANPESRILACMRDGVTGLDAVVMQFSGTRTLRDVIDDAVPDLYSQTPPVSRSNAAGYRQFISRTILDVAKSVSKLHAVGILHLDIKPENIVCNEDGSAALVDFNLSIPVVRAAGAAFRGTLPYAAPEVLDGAARGGLPDRPYSYAVDVYSLGVLIYEALTGTFPHAPQRVGDFAARAKNLLEQRKKVPVAPSVLSTMATPGLDSIVLKAIAFHSSERYPSAAALLSALEQEFEVASERMGGGSRESGWRRKVRPNCIVVAAILASGALATALGLLPSEDILSVGESPGVHFVESLPAVPSAMNERPDDGGMARSRGKNTTGGVVASLLRSERYKDAINSLEEDIANGANGSGSEVLLAYSMFQAGDYTGAARVLGSVSELSEVPEGVLFLGAVVELKRAQQECRPPRNESFRELLDRRSESAVELAAIAVAFADSEACRVARGRTVYGQRLFYAHPSSVVGRKAIKVKRSDILRRGPDSTLLPQFEDIPFLCEICD